MPRPKSKKNMYFHEGVQDAIIRYNAVPDNHALRNKIYGEEIHAAFMKLAENIINTFKFSYFDYGFEEVKCEVVAFLVMNMHKYDHTKGSKAFSYFSVVAKNYLILHNNANYKKLKIHSNIDTIKMRHSNSEEIRKNFSDLTDEIINYFEANISSLFNKKRDIDIAYAIVELLKRRDEIENFNKKSLYILIREMTNVNTTYITNVINVFRKKYKKLLNEYHRHGRIEPNSELKKFLG